MMPLFWLYNLSKGDFKYKGVKIICQYLVEQAQGSVNVDSRESQA